MYSGVGCADFDWLESWRLRHGPRELRPEATLKSRVCKLGAKGPKASFNAR